MNPPVPGPTEGLNAAVAAELRAEAGAKRLSDKALAEKAGVNYASLRRWLGKDTGNERHIDVAVLSTLADALEISPVEIVDRARKRVDVVWNDEVSLNVTSIEERLPSPPDVQKSAARKPRKD